ncbi:MAG: anaerobic ribonucleoside-triphosphate reductase activating protein [Paramuribaculum sp.]|nr:anaerobic ribonucleoside-triphosphate reductase activating protein [Paramuribaculum sp.]
MYNILRIVDGTSVDGPHLRTSIYLAGCTHHCPGCHNPQSWDPTGGTPMTLDEIMSRIEDNDMDVTLTGGDPLRDPALVMPLMQAIKERGRSLWVYTGYTFELLLEDAARRQLLPYIDVLVDGPFVMALRDTSLLFCGSSNQRLIDVAASLTHQVAVLWEDNF